MIWARRTSPRTIGARARVSKKIGYRKHVAAAVEAAASTGGQLMPPNDAARTGARSPSTIGSSTAVMVTSTWTRRRTQLSHCANITAVVILAIKCFISFWVWGVVVIVGAVPPLGPVAAAAAYV